MCLRRLLDRSGRRRQSVSKNTRCRNRLMFRELLDWFAPEGELFSKHEFHGNTKWNAEQLTCQALIWSWQETKNVTDAFDYAQEICDDLGMRETARSYTSMMNALERYHDILVPRLREQFQRLAKEVGDQCFHVKGWVPIGFDGSRATAPRSVDNETVFCATDYGKGKRAKYGKRKSKGMRRKRNQQNPPQPQAPQAWVTMLWHMGLRLPWTWRLGPSNSSERDHVKEILREETFPKNTLFCGDAGFTGYPLWSLLLAQGNHFLVRVGSNVRLLSEHANVKKLGGGFVLCWPKGQMDSGQPPLNLRLVQVRIGKTKMWMLTSVTDRRQLSKKQIARFYKMRWGIEIEFRGLKQTIDKHTLRCRNSNRLLIETDWSLRAMAVAELLALREQIDSQKENDPPYDPQDRSLANTMRALRKCMRKLNKYCNDQEGLKHDLSRAKVQRYNNKTDKRARYRRKNKDKKPLSEPTVRKLNENERRILNQLTEPVAV